MYSQTSVLVTSAYSTHELSIDRSDDVIRCAIISEPSSQQSAVSADRRTKRETRAGARKPLTHVGLFREGSPPFRFSTSQVVVVFSNVVAAPKQPPPAHNNWTPLRIWRLQLSLLRENSPLNLVNTHFQSQNPSFSYVTSQPLQVKRKTINMHRFGLAERVQEKIIPNIQKIYNKIGVFLLKAFKWTYKCTDILHLLQGIID